MEETARRDCGYFQITQQECEGKNCCYQETADPENPEHYPWCFYKVPPPPPPPPTPPPTPPAPTTHGIAVSVAGARVELAVEGGSAFRVSLDYEGSSGPHASRMVAPKTQYASFQVVHDDDWVGIKTSFGQVRVTPAGEFELLSASGKTLSQSKALGTLKSDKITVKLGGAGTRAYYAAGASHGTPLVASKSTPYVHNDYGSGAVSWLPQYFSLEDGYGALAVSSQDFQHDNPAYYPARWTSGGDGVTWSIDGYSADLYLMPAADLYEYARANAELTGVARLPPRYTFGFLACQWGWKDKSDIEDKLNNFRSGNFPIDAFISDFEWFTTENDYGIGTQGKASYHDFNWNSKTFPSPVEQLQEYKKMGFHFGAIRKPRFGNSGNLAECRSNGWLLPGGESGSGRNMNFTTAAARKWYQEKNQHYLEEGVDFWWNDEAEVSYFQFDGWNQAQSDGFAVLDAQKRFYSLNRVYTPGLQTYGLAVWTGDIPVSWTALAQQPAYLLNLGLAGMPYVACDTGGFVGGNAQPEMLSRWYWQSAFMSVMRVHSTQGRTAHFPWYYGDEAATAMRKALETRYRMIPTLYSLAHTNFLTGAPIMRPLLMEFGGDEKVAGITDQWLVGTGLMPAPVQSAGGKRSVYLPKGATWYEFETTTTHQGGQTLSVSVPLDAMPIYARAGMVLPLSPVIQHTGQLAGEALQVQVYAGADGSFTLYEDDGATKAYEGGKVRATKFEWKDSHKTLSWSVTGSFSDGSTFSEVKVVLFSTSRKQESATKSLGKSGTISFTTMQYV